MVWQIGAAAALESGPRAAETTVATITSPMKFFATCNSPYQDVHFYIAALVVNLEAAGNSISKITLESRLKNELFHDWSTAIVTHDQQP